VIRCLAAAVVDQDGLAEQARDEEGRERREQEREVRRRKGVDDVGAPQLAEQQRPVDELRDDCADVFDACEVRQRPRGNRVDRDEPRVDIAVVAPRAQESIRLDCLAAEDAKRRGDERDAKGRHAGVRLQTTRLARSEPRAVPSERAQAGGVLRRRNTRCSA
jgi:hypothetical protein